MRSTLGLALDFGTPVAVVDGCVLEQSGEDEHETHDEVDVDGFDVGDSRQRRPDAGTNGRHRQNGRYACTRHYSTPRLGNRAPPGRTDCALHNKDYVIMFYTPSNGLATRRQKQLIVQFELISVVVA